MIRKLQLLTWLTICFVVLISAIAMQAQTTTSNTTSNTATVPRLIRYAGVARDVNGKALTSVVGITFLLYAEQTGGAALWMETQNVQTDSSGHYAVLLGSTKLDGLPAELFNSEQARWIGVQIEQQAEQARTLLVSAPYALKAGDAETLGGLPPSAFVLAPPATAGNDAWSSSAGSAANAGQNAPDITSDVTTTGGTANTIPMFTTAANIQNSILTQTGKTAVNVGGKLNLPTTGTATTAKGFDSQAQDFVASVYNSTSKAAVVQTFQLQAEPAGNDTATASGTLNLLYGSGPAIPTETGLKISNKGLITFASGQTFPGTGDGTITGVTAGSGLSGGGVTGTITLKNTGVLSITAGTGITSSGGQTPTIGINTSVVPELSAANTFTKSQTVNGSLTASGTVSGGTVSAGAITSGTVPTAGSITVVGDVREDINGTNNGTTNSPGIRFGSGNTGEGISSARTSGAPNQNGLNFNTDFIPRMTISNEGMVGIGVLQPNTYQLSIIPPNAATGSGAAGTPALYSQGSSADPNGLAVGGIGIVVEGGTGGSENVSGNGGDAVDAYAGAAGNGNGGAGLSATGGEGNGGDGVSTGSGGAGVVATGGGSEELFGGDGIDASGGAGGCCNDYASTSGNGVVGSGGPGSYQESDGDGGYFVGGNQSIDGFGIEVIAGSDDAGFFSGDVLVTGSVTSSSAGTKVDHPLDPANRYLSHASVESSEMINIYTGNVTTDALGDVQIPLPDWFEAVNTNFRYQLTVIGQFAQAIVSSKVANHQFAIKTDKPNVEVSWQITGVRQDAFAKAHPLVVEQEKNARERGFYLNPELYGAVAERGMVWSHHPNTLRRIAQLRAQHARPIRPRTQSSPRSPQPAPAAKTVSATSKIAKQ